MIFSTPHDRKGKKAGFIGLMAVAFSCASAAFCVDSTGHWQLANVSSRSEWNEFNAVGRILVHESGPLIGAALSAAYDCDKWHYLAGITQLNGTRIYDGKTNNGAPAISQSTIQQRFFQVQAIRKITDTWKLGTRLSNQTLWREIASIDSAAGYPERFDWTLLSLGAQWHSELGPGQLTIQAWSGKQLQSRMVLTLPGRDQTSLALSSMSQIELAAGWRMQLNPAWHLQADIGYRHSEMAQGSPTVITRGGSPTGVAYQPKTVMLDRPISIQIGFEF